MHGCTILIQYPFMFRDLKVNYFTSNLPASSFETDRQKFLGENGYGTWGNPIGLQAPELSNTQALRGDNIAALLHHLGVLQPGKSKRLITQLGQVDQHRERAGRDRASTGRPRKSIGLWPRSRRSGMLICRSCSAHTPDADFNRMINVHNARQCYITKQWSRYLSLYQLGYGARGIGTRDSSQDVMAVLASVPDEGKALIKQLLSVQRRNGSAYHQFNPLTMIASEGDSLEREDRPHYYSDDHLWSVLVVSAYLKETGDCAFLDEVIPYYEKDKQEQPLESWHGARSPEARHRVYARRCGAAWLAAPRLCRLERHDQSGDGRGVVVQRQPVRARAARDDRVERVSGRCGLRAEVRGVLRRDEGARQRARLGRRMVRGLLRSRRHAAGLEAEQVRPDSTQRRRRGR